MLSMRRQGEESKSWVVSSNILLRTVLAGATDLRGPAIYTEPSSVRATLI